MLRINWTTKKKKRPQFCANLSSIKTNKKKVRGWRVYALPQNSFSLETQPCIPSGPGAEPLSVMSHRMALSALLACLCIMGGSEAASSLQGCSSVLESQLERNKGQLREKDMKEDNPKGCRLMASGLDLEISKCLWKLWANGYFQVLQMMNNVVLCLHWV